MIHLSPRRYMQGCLLTMLRLLIGRVLGPVAIADGISFVVNEYTVVHIFLLTTVTQGQKVIISSRLLIVVSRVSLRGQLGMVLQLLRVQFLTDTPAITYNFLK